MSATNTVKRLEIVRELAKRIRDRGYNVTFDETAPYLDRTLTIDGVHVGWSFYIQEMREHTSSFRRKPTGKYQIAVGSYGNRKVFRELKAGGFRWDDLIEALLIEARKLQREVNGAKQRTCNTQLVAQFCEEIGDKIYGSGLSVDVTEDECRPVDVTFRKHMTVEQVKLLWEKLQEIGVV